MWGRLKSGGQPGPEGGVVSHLEQLVERLAGGRQDDAVASDAGLAVGEHHVGQLLGAPEPLQQRAQVAQVRVPSQLDTGPGTHHAAEEHTVTGVRQILVCHMSRALVIHR